jgi:hypothetical protein
MPGGLRGRKCVIQPRDSIHYDPSIGQPRAVASTHDRATHPDDFACVGPRTVDAKLSDTGAGNRERRRRSAAVVLADMGLAIDHKGA